MNSRIPLVSKCARLTIKPARPPQRTIAYKQLLYLPSYTSYPGAMLRPPNSCSSPKESYSQHLPDQSRPPSATPPDCFSENDYNVHPIMRIQPQPRRWQNLAICTHTIRPVNQRITPSPCGALASANLNKTAAITVRSPVALITKEQERILTPKKAN